jgi:pimeloyl-ACP methyl ester carboxylesterase
MKVIVQNIATEYSDSGSGRTILMLHGWLDNYKSFDDIALELEKTYRIVRFDFPGMGQSELPKAAWDVERYASFAGEFISKLSLNPYAIIGHSFGGRVAIKAISSGIISPEKLILISSAGVAEKNAIRTAIFKLAAVLVKPLLSIPIIGSKLNSYKSSFYKRIGSDYDRNERLKPTFRNVVGEDLTIDAKKIPTRTLIIYGERDATTPISEGKKLNSLIGDSHFEVINNAGHFVHKDQSSRVTALISDFIHD